MHFRGKPQDLLDTKVHQLWQYDEQYDIWYPSGEQFSDEDYATALRHASYALSNQGRTVKLVTSVITFVI